MDVSKRAMEEALKTLNIGTKMMARRSHATCDILLGTEEAVMALTEYPHHQEAETAN